MQHRKLHDLREKNQTLNMKTLEGPHGAGILLFSVLQAEHTFHLNFSQDVGTNGLAFPRDPG